MRSFTIVGAGQAGLMLALGLEERGHDVRLVTNRTADDIRTGRVMSSQCMFHPALEHERALGLDYWVEACPKIHAVTLTVAGSDSGKLIDWGAPLEEHAQAVDQRVKIPLWLEEFERRGGTVEVCEAGVNDLERYAASSDLVLVAAGKGDIVRNFERDPSRSPYDRPQRALALTYVQGLTPHHEAAINYSVIPGVGEYFVFPSLTTSGLCDIMVFEGVPDGPMDCWDGIDSPDRHLEQSLRILDTFLPWEAERARRVELTDDHGILTGRFPPTVRKPVAELPSGRVVLGVADVVVLNDPLTGQGSNNASRCAATYLASIEERGGAPFDRQWMEATFGRYWDYARHVTRWTNTMLEPPPHVVEVLAAAQRIPAVAHRFVHGLTDPGDFESWFFDPRAAAGYLSSLAVATR